MEIVNILKRGGIAVIPTDTVYGIVCDATNLDSVNRVYNLKGRDRSKAMIILVSDIDMLKRCTREINEIEEDMINKFLPGPLTIIFKKSEYISDLVSAGMDLIGIRIPDDEKLIKIIKELDRPIIATSANVSSQETITSIDLLDESIKDSVDYIKDAGYVNNVGSTIVKVVDNKVNILRDGFLSDKIKDTYIK